MPWEHGAEGSNPSYPSLKGIGVIGNTSDFGSEIKGSSPLSPNLIGDYMLTSSKASKTLLTAYSKGYRVTKDGVVISPFRVEPP